MNPCNPCSCGGAFVNSDTSFRLAVINALCEIKDLLAGGIAVTVVPPASATSVEAVIDVEDTTTSVLTANVARLGGWVKNISDTDIYVSLSGAASLLGPTLIEPGNVLTLGVAGLVVYRGAVSAIHAAAGLQKQLEVVEF